MSAVALTVLAVGLMLLMVMFAARSGPDRIFTGPLHDPSVHPITPSLSIPSPPVLPRGRHHTGLIHSNPFFTTLGWLLRVAFVLCALWLLYKAFRWVEEALANLRARRRPPRPVPVEFDVLDDPEPLVEEIRRGADEQFELLLGGLPRNAIVACWDRFEEHAERVNAARKPWETSSEFTLRLLDAVTADSAAVARLEALYREARFSAHEIDEARREAAVEALRAIHASLRAGASLR